MAGPKQRVPRVARDAQPRPKLVHGQSGKQRANPGQIEMGVENSVLSCGRSPDALDGDKKIISNLRTIPRRLEPGN